MLDHKIPFAFEFVENSWHVHYKLFLLLDKQTLKFKYNN